MALATLAAGFLRATLPTQLRNGDARWLFLAVIVALLVALIAGDPGRIDRDAPWLQVLTGCMIGLITLSNTLAALRLVNAIINNTSIFNNNAKVLLASGGAIWLTNVIVFGLWYWDLDRGGPAARAGRSTRRPALIFPEMNNEQYVDANWYPKFVDYFHFSFSTATAFSPTDVSAIRPWMKLMMIGEEAISLIVALLVVARAVNILK